MGNEIEIYNESQSAENEKICKLLMHEINCNLAEAKSKIWHGSPVWFIDDNPVVGYCKLKNCIQLLFWSGQTFEEKGLKPEGKYKASEARYTEVNQINIEELTQWIRKSREIQWDYKNIIRRKGVLERLK